MGRGKRKGEEKERESKLRRGNRKRKRGESWEGGGMGWGGSGEEVGREQARDSENGERERDGVEGGRAEGRESESERARKGVRPLHRRACPPGRGPAPPVSTCSWPSHPTSGWPIPWCVFACARADRQIAARAHVRTLPSLPLLPSPHTHTRETCSWAMPIG